MKDEEASLRPIGVFDSGLGDSARVPYGTKSLETIRRFALEDAAFLLRFSPKMIVVACNSATAAAIDVLRASLPVDVVDVIRPSAEAAARHGKGPIGVIGTEATVASGAYERALAELAPGRAVSAVACPLLVPIVEEGRDESDPIVTHVLCDYLRDLQRLRPDVLILGCTHYPLLAGAIGKLMGPGTLLVNSGQAAATEARRRLEAAGLRNPRRDPAATRCFTTDNPRRFAAVARRFGAGRIERVAYVGTDELEAQGLPQRDASGLGTTAPRTVHCS